MESGSDAQARICVIGVCDTGIFMVHSRTCGNGAQVRCAIAHMCDWSLGDLPLHKHIPAHVGIECGSDAHSRKCMTIAWDDHQSLHKCIPAHAGMESGSDAQSRKCMPGVWDRHQSLISSWSFPHPREGFYVLYVLKK